MFFINICIVKLKLIKKKMFRNAYIIKKCCEMFFFNKTGPVPVQSGPVPGCLFSMDRTGLDQANFSVWSQIALQPEPTQTI